MPKRNNVGGTDRIARAVLAVALAALAVRSLRSGKHSRGAAATLGALAFGYNAKSCYCGLNAILGRDTSGD